MTSAAPSKRSRKGCKHGFPKAPIPLSVGLENLRVLPPGLETVTGELWLIARRLREWLDTPTERHHELLAGSSARPNLDRLHQVYAEAGSIAGAVAVLHPIGSYVIHPDPTIVACACHEIAEWCEQQGLLEIGIRYADALTALRPNDPWAANLAGRLSRDAGYLRRAETLFNRGVGLAQGCGDAEAKARAYLGWGTLQLRRGDFDKARRYYNRAGNRLRKDGTKSLAGEVFHDIMLMSIESGSYLVAQKYAHRAFRWYPVHHERLPRAVHDFALLLIWQCYFGPAMPLLAMVVEHVDPPADRAMIWSTLARAAGGARELEEFLKLRDLIMALLAEFDRYAPAVLVNLAFGAYFLGRIEEGREFALAGLQAARKRSGCKVEESVAGDLITLIDNRVTPPAPKPLPQYESGRDGATLKDLIAQTTRLIRRWHGPTWRQKDQDGPERRGKT